MIEASQEYESPSRNSQSSASRGLHSRDLYNSASGDKYGSPEGDLKYERLKRTEKEISDNIDRAERFQNERLSEGLQSNTFYKRELQNLRSNLNETRNKVKSNHYPADTDDFLIKSTKEKIRQLQAEREKEISQDLDNESSPEKREEDQADRYVHSNFEDVSSARKEAVRERQSQREGEIYHNLYPKEEEFLTSSQLKESIGSSQMYDLSQSLKSSSADQRSKMSGRLQNLGDKMNQMEKELDNHLVSQNNKYYTNKELVREKQKQREQEIQRKQRLQEEENEDEYYEEDEEEQQMESIQERTKSGRAINSARENKNNNFKEAFNKREEKLRKESQDLEKEITRRTVNFADEEDRDEEKNEDQEEEEEEPGDQRNIAFEAELERLKEENYRIKKELIDVKENYLSEKKYGRAEIHAADFVSGKNYDKIATKPEIRVNRVPTVFSSEKAFQGQKREENIKQTMRRARQQVQQKLNINNKSHGSKSVSKKESTKAPEYLGTKNEVYKRYYGRPVHLKEATYFLNKGIPTSYMSDSRLEVQYKDPKKTIPKRFEKVLKCKY